MKLNRRNFMKGLGSLFGGMLIGGKRNQGQKIQPVEPEPEEIGDAYIGLPKKDSLTSLQEEINERLLDTQTVDWGNMSSGCGPSYMEGYQPLWFSDEYLALRTVLVIAPTIQEACQWIVRERMCAIEEGRLVDIARLNVYGISRLLVGDVYYRAVDVRRLESVYGHDITNTSVLLLKPHLFPNDNDILEYVLGRYSLEITTPEFDGQQALYYIRNFEEGTIGRGTWQRIWEAMARQHPVQIELSSDER